MVKIQPETTDPAAAWHVRDQLATHPLLGGATAGVLVTAHAGAIFLHGWALDAHIRDIARTLAQRAAGRRTVRVEISVRAQPWHGCAGHVALDID